MFHRQRTTVGQVDVKRLKWSGGVQLSQLFDRHARILIFWEQSNKLGGQQRHADAEPLLLQGYEGMKQREAKIPPQAKDLRLREALERLVQLYDPWGKSDEAAKWLKRRETAKKPK